MLMQADIAARVASEAKKRPVVAVFDRDGTLVPICTDETAAVMPLEVKVLLRKLALSQNMHVGVLSARGLNRLSLDFAGDGLILSGNYGLEVLFPDERSFVHPLAQEARNSLSAIKERIQAGVHRDAASNLEDHGLSLCLHWRFTPPEHQKSIHDLIEKLQAETTDLHFRALPTSYEVLPQIFWNKGYGLAKLIEMLEFTFADVLVIYAGDSEFDEPAFAWTNEHNGISVRVGRAEKTEAQYQLEDPSRLIELIRELSYIL